MMRALQEPMTIAELKRHTDRRFDRLERTKASREDLRRFATKRDLRRFATKQELRREIHSVRVEIRSLRQDFRRWAIDIKRHFKVVAESLEEKIARVADASGQTAQIKVRVEHHRTVLDDHETRITAIEQRA